MFEGSTPIRDVRVAAPLKRTVERHGADDRIAYPRRTRRGPVEAVRSWRSCSARRSLSATYASRPR